MKSIPDHKYSLVKQVKILCYHKYSLAEQPNVDEKNNLPGYPTYPVGEDIYQQDKEDKEIDPEQITIEEELSENSQKDFDEDSLDSGLDIPGSELDDEQEKIGSEDEENNYYSLGDDDSKE